MDLKKELLVCWSCHFKLATNISLSFSDVVYNFIIFARVNPIGLSIKNVANNWAWCWTYATFTIGRGLSSTSKESKASALRSNLGGSILSPQAISTNSDNFANTTRNWTKLPPKEVNFRAFHTICQLKQSEKYWVQNPSREWTTCDLADLAYFNNRVWEGV